MKNIIITGTSGALGNNLRQYFTDRGFNVIGTVGRSTPREGEHPINLSDWASFADLKEAINGIKIDAIIHSAAALQGKFSIKKTYAVNVTGTENILRLADERDCGNFIQISSIGVYGICSLGKNRTEKTHPFDIEPYGITKRKAEIHVRKSGVPYTILRLPLIKYSGDFYITECVKRGKSVFIRKNELNIVSSVTPEFVSKTCEWIINNGPLNDSYNCASHHQTWRELVIDHCSHEGIEIINKKYVSVFGVFSMGIVIGPIALFGQHTPSDKLKVKIVPRDKSIKSEKRP